MTTDPLDRYFPRLGPCLICGVPGEDQRHRVVDAIAEMVRAGDDPQCVADDYGVSLAAVRCAVRYAPDYWPEGEL